MSNAEFAWSTGMVLTLRDDILKLELPLTKVKYYIDDTTNKAYGQIQVVHGYWKMAIDLTPDHVALYYGSLVQMLKESYDLSDQRSLDRIFEVLCEHYQLKW